MRIAAVCSGSAPAALQPTMVRTWVKPPSLDHWNAPRSRPSTGPTGPNALPTLAWRHRYIHQSSLVDSPVRTNPAKAPARQQIAAVESPLVVRRPARSTVDSLRTCAGGHHDGLVRGAPKRASHGIGLSSKSIPTATVC